MSHEIMENDKDIGSIKSVGAVLGALVFLISANIVGRMVSDRIGANDGRGEVATECPNNYYSYVEINLNTPGAVESLQEAASKHDILDSFARKSVQPDKATLLGELVCLQVDQNTSANQAVLLPAGLEALSYYQSIITSPLPAGFSFKG